MFPKRQKKELCKGLMDFNIAFGISFFSDGSFWYHLLLGWEAYVSSTKYNSMECAA
jgi:hypothetical protein